MTVEPQLSYDGQHHGWSQTQTAHPQTSHPQADHPQADHPQPGHPQTAYPHADYPQAGYPAAGYPQAGYPQVGYPQTGYPQVGSPQAGHAAQGYGTPVPGVPPYPAPPNYGAGGFPAGQPIHFVPPVTGPYGDPPSVVPVVIFTAVFGIFGALSASRRAKKASVVGVGAKKYWVAFGATMAAGWVLGLIIMAVLMVAGAATATGSAGTGTPTATSTWLENSIVTEGDFTDQSGKAAKPLSATCTATAVDENGTGTYRCVVDFSGKDRQTFEVTVDATGEWVTNLGK